MGVGVRTGVSRKFEPRPCAWEQQIDGKTQNCEDFAL